MTNQTLIRIILSFFLLTYLALGDYDVSGGAEAKNLSMAEFNALGIESQAEEAALGAGAPQVAATSAGTELAVYSDQAPSAQELGKVLPSDISANYPMYIYYDGSYLGWNDFSATFPTSQPGLWIERAAGWSWYATMPLGAWAKELLYVPTSSPLTLYEIYPGGYVRSYDLGFAQPGYYYIWYYADSPGRHRSILATSTGFSNMVVIDVYSPQPPRPTPPSPKEQCESNPLCSWANGQCLCRGWNPDNPEKEKCEENPTCDWFNGHCYCRGLIPDDSEKEKCEQNPSCHWVDGRCLCTGFGPITSGESGESGNLLGSEQKELDELDESN
ncbi:MAG: hypothetical protein QUS09_10215 [Methanotrichaceae archaeon]|nr:hypothetical protein [Methanotrichaceae archaeon]